MRYEEIREERAKENERGKRRRKKKGFCGRKYWEKRKENSKYARNVIKRSIQRLKECCKNEHYREKIKFF